MASSPWLLRLRSSTHTGAAMPSNIDPSYLRPIHRPLRQDFSLREVSSLSGVLVECLHTHESRRRWLVNQLPLCTNLNLDVGHFLTCHDWSECTIAFTCPRCLFWLRSATCVLEHLQDDDDCRQFEDLSLSLNKNNTDYQRVLAAWAPQAPSLANLCWLMHDSLDCVMVCPRCHLICKRASALQEHLRKRCVAVPLTRLPLTLRTNSVSILPSLESAGPSGMLSAFLPVGFMTLAATRRYIQVTYSATLTQITFTRASILSARKLRKSAPWASLPKKVWLEVVNFLL